MSGEIELKPCPFCSSARIHDETINGETIAVWCHQCGASFSLNYGDKIDIRAVWNTRPSVGDGTQRIKENEEREKHRAKIEKMFYDGAFRDYDNVLAEMPWLFHELELLNDRAALSTVKEGWQIVPKELTKEMMIAGSTIVAGVAYGPYRLTCNPDTRFGSWCISNAGSWVYRAERTPTTTKERRNG